MPSPADCRYSETHEWFRAEGDVVTMGITQHAADELSDLTYVELKPVGTHVAASEPIGEVESVKTTSEVYSAVEGEIVEVNQAAIDDPSILNSDPFGDGWLVRIRVDDTSSLDGLLDHVTYDQKNGIN